DTLVGRKDPDGKKFFYHPDHLGSTDLVTDESGNVVEESTYEPYGEIIDGGDSRFLYTAKELDKGTGLYYYGARYYDPLFMHFIQCELIKPDIYNPQALNCYAYALNNPYKYVDPEGLWAVQVGPVLSGGIGLGNFGIGGRVGATLGISYSKEKGFQLGLVASAGGGPLYGGLKLGVDVVSISPFVKSIDEFGGNKFTVGGSGAIPPVTIGGDVKVYSGGNILKNVLSNVKDPSSYSVSAGFGGGYSVYGFGQKIEVTTLIGGSSRGSTLSEGSTNNNLVNNQYSSQTTNLNKPQYSSVNNRQNVNQNRASQNNRGNIFSRFFSSIRSRFRFSRFRGSGQS
ncbi:MAG: RHS repeat-associated core domain-containing protein, partial [Nanoarchaeota archaeon]